MPLHNVWFFAILTKKIQRKLVSEKYRTNRKFRKIEKVTKTFLASEKIE